VSAYPDGEFRLQNAQDWGARYLRRAIDGTASSYFSVRSLCFSFSYCCRTASTSRRTPRFLSRGRASNSKAHYDHTHRSASHFTGPNACCVASYYYLTLTEVSIARARTDVLKPAESASRVSLRCEVRSPLAQSAAARPPNSPRPLRAECGGDRGDFLSATMKNGAVESGVSLLLPVATLDSSAEFTPSTDAIVSGNGS